MKDYAEEVKKANSTLQVCKGLIEAAAKSAEEMSVALLEEDGERAQYYKDLTNDIVDKIRALFDDLYEPVIGRK